MSHTHRTVQGAAALAAIRRISPALYRPGRRIDLLAQRIAHTVVVAR